MVGRRYDPPPIFPSLPVPVPASLPVDLPPVALPPQRLQHSATTNRLQPAEIVDDFHYLEVRDSSFTSI